MKNMNATYLLCTMLLALVSSAVSAEPSVNVELRKSKDKVSIETTNGTMIVAVTSVSGIGGARIIRPGESWPTNVVIRLTLKNLESFNIKTPNRSAHGALGDSRGLTITQTNDYIEIVVPQEFVKEQPGQIELSWIDAYR